MIGRRIPGRIATTARRSLAAAAVACLALPGSDALAAPDAARSLLITAIGRDGPEILLAPIDDGPARQLTDSRGGNEHPRWSPDGARIAFVSYRDGNAEIYAMEPDGSGQTRLTRDDAADGEPQWSPDGRRLAFVSTRTGMSTIWLMNADGSDPRQLAAATPGEQSSPRWSPGGDRIAFLAAGGRGTDLVVARTDGSRAASLTASNTKLQTQPAWSPDGRRVAFVRYGSDAAADIVVVDADGNGRETNLTSALRFVNTRPAWSPDGTKLAFLSTREHADGTRANLFVMNGDGTGLEHVGGPPDLEHLSVAWSADGERLYYAVAPWGSSLIRSIGADGSEPRQLSRGRVFDLDPQPCCTSPRPRPQVAAAVDPDMARLSSRAR